MKGRWIPFLATTACLALAATAPAQDRGRRSGGGGSGNDRSSRSSSSDTRSSRPDRSTPRDDRSSRSSDRSAPSPRDDRSSRDDRSYRDSRSGRDEGRGFPGGSPASGTTTNRPYRREDPTSYRGGSDTSPRATDTRRGGFGGTTGTTSTRPYHTEDPRPTRDTSPRGNEDRSTSTDHRSPGSRDDRPSRGGGSDARPDGAPHTDRRTPFDRETRGSGFGADRGRGSNSHDYSGGHYSRPSRSGTVSYGTYHNGFGFARPTRYGGGFNHAILGENIHRNRPSGGFSFVFGGVYGGLRYGYVGYNSYWRDDNFAYPFYVFDPWSPSVACVASPWYRYSYLPPYLDTSRVVVINNYDSSWGSNDGWRDYDYRNDDRDRRNESLDTALGDIRDSFERNDDRAADDILPETGQVAIFNDGKYDYSLGVDDFRDMFLDGVKQSKTSRYEIVESRVKGDEVHVRARHEYTDSWGADQTVFHTYTLRRESGGRYVIREFGTD